MLPVDTILACERKGSPDRPESGVARDGGQRKAYVFVFCCSCSPSMYRGRLTNVKAPGLDGAKTAT